MKLIQVLEVLAIYHELEGSDDKDFGLIDGISPIELLSALQGTVSLVQKYGRAYCLNRFYLSSMTRDADSR